MLDSIAPWIVWPCIIAFVICVSAGLAFMLGLWKPDDSKIGNRLLALVLLTAVPPVGSVVPQLLNGHLFPKTAPSASSEPDETTPTGDPSVPDGPGTGTPDPTGTPPPEPPPNEPPDVTYVRDWAENELGTRPLKAEDIDKAFPACAELVAAQPESAARDVAAKDCEATIRSFRNSFIAPYYKAKEAYEAKLVAQEHKLQNSNDPNDANCFDYVLSEKRRLNRPKTGDLARLAIIDQRSKAAASRCLKSKCRSA